MAAVSVVPSLILLGWPSAPNGMLCIVSIFKGAVFVHVSKGFDTVCQCMLYVFSHNVCFFCFKLLVSKSNSKGSLLLLQGSVSLTLWHCNQHWFSRMGLNTSCNTNHQAAMAPLFAEYCCATFTNEQKEAARFLPALRKEIFLYIWCLSLLLLVINILVHELRWIMLILQITKAEERCI